MRLLLAAVILFGPAGAARAADPPVVSCTVSCPPGAINENEPTCFNGYYDVTNGGCISGGWTHLYPQSASTTVACGTSGDYDRSMTSYRDTDWFEVCTISSHLPVTVTVTAEFDPLVTIYYATSGTLSCSNYNYVYTSGLACLATTAIVSGGLPPPVQIWPLVAPVSFVGVPCGSRYVMTVDNIAACTWTDVPSPGFTGASWGTVKSLHR